MLIEKIKERLKAKFPGVNLSKTRIEALASRLNAKISEETEIDQALDDANSIFPFADLAKEDDRVRTLEAKAKDPKTEEKTDPSKVDVPEDAPAWAKGIIEANKALTEKLESFEKGKTKDTFLQKAKKALEEKKIPDAFSKGFLKSFDAADDDALNNFISEVETSFTEFKQGSNNERFNNSDQPGAATASADTVKGDIEAWAKSKGPTEA